MRSALLIAFAHRLDRPPGGGNPSDNAGFGITQAINEVDSGGMVSNGINAKYRLHLLYTTSTSASDGKCMVLKVRCERKAVICSCPYDG